MLGEFWHGAIKAGHSAEVVRKFLLSGLPIYDVAEVVPICALYTEIGQNDLWIAAAALSLNLPLVTRNVRDFDKFAGLRLEALVQAVAVDFPVRLRRLWRCAQTTCAAPWWNCIS